MDKREGITFFRRKFLSHSAGKNFVARTLVFQKTSGSENKIWIRGRVSRFSVESFLSHTAGKNLEEPFCARMKFS